MALSKRNNLIDLLRFIAAIAVVLHHMYFQVHFLPPSFYFYFYFTYGKLGVPMFFVISGYCILLALNHAKTPYEFIVRRVFRIFPPYWFSLLLTLAVIILLKFIRGENSVAVLPKSFGDIVGTLALLTFPITHITSINWVYWTLPYEVMFYLAVFLCSFAKRNYFTLALIVITSLSCLMPSTDFGFMSFFKFWPLFAIGAALFKILHEERSLRKMNAVLFAVALFAFYPAHQSLPFVITGMLTVILIIIGHYKPLRDNLFSRLGDVSYSIYLIHVPLTAYCFGVYRDVAPLKGSVYLNLLVDIILLIYVVLAAKIIFKYIELPSINLGKKIAAILR